MENKFIEIGELKKTYLSKKKREGFLGGVRFFFKTDYFNIEALKGISFDVFERIS